MREDRTMMKVEPCDEHRWLLALVGDWTIEMEHPGGPGEPGGTLRGRETVRPLGEVWIVAEGEGEMPGGGPGRTMMTLGYDPSAGRYRGSWIGSMMTAMWVYDGARDGGVLTLDTEGPDFAHEGKRARYRDIVDVRDRDYRQLRSEMQDAQGRWTPFMTAHYRRVR
jgi:hypothetical protein